MKNLNTRGDNNNKIMEFQGHGGIKHFGNSEGKGGIKGGWKPSMVWYEYFLESPIINFSPVANQSGVWTLQLQPI